MAGLVLPDGNDEARGLSGAMTRWTQFFAFVPFGMALFWPVAVSATPARIYVFDGPVDTATWTISNGWNDGSFVDTDWLASQVRPSKTGLSFVLEKNKSTSTGFASGEIISHERYRYGYFEASMQAARGDGLVTGFFTYTGPVHHAPWNEIDVEILGRDTRHARFTYHVQGENNQSVTVALPFDAASGYHDFGFDWQPGYIRWYVDGRPMLTVTGRQLPLPTESQEIVFDLWNGRKMDGWTGTFHWTGQPLIARLRCVAYAPRYDGGMRCRR